MVDFCSDVSRALREPLTATAPQNDAYFLLEYREAWQPKAAKPGNNTLREAVTAHIQASIKASGLSVKPMFIRQQGRTNGPLMAYVARPTAEGGTVYALELETYDALTDVPLSDMLRGEPGTGVLLETPLFTVCAHKERDRACGKYGWGIYQALRDAAGETAQVWQSTHIGGHRFAGTLIAFPYGTFYGHLDTDDVSAVLAATQAGQVYTPKLRGRSVYGMPTQAALASVRAEIEDNAVDALVPVINEATGDKSWRVVLRHGGAQYTVAVQEVVAEYEIVKSSGSDPEPITQFVATIVSRVDSLV